MAADATLNGLRPDLRLIANLVEPTTRVLDAGVHECVSRGLAVVQGDADTDLAIYPAASFDYVILSQTIQAMREPRQVLENMLRIGRFGIVSFTNYGYWRARWHLMLRGRMPSARCRESSAAASIRCP